MINKPLMEVVKLRQGRIDMLMCIEDDGISSQLFACIQEMIDEYGKTGKGSALDAEALMENVN